MNRPPLIALLTDFGTRDWYVAAIRGVLLARAPRARLIDITHEIPPQDITAGAFTLAAAAPWFPPGTVFLTVVDPGVGSRRALIAVRAGRQSFVGPDNGLLALALERAKRVRIVQLTNRRYWLGNISQTFQGRDILAPVAAYLASGGSLGRLGPAVPRVVPLDLPAVERRGRSAHGHLVHIDAFGNLITNLPASLLEEREGARPVVRYQRHAVRVVSSYTDGRAHELIALPNSLGLIELAIREGSAAWTVNAKRGDKVELTV